MKKWIGAAIMAFALNFGGSAAIDPAAAAPLAKESQASNATDFSAHRRYYRHRYRHYRPYYRAYYRPYRPYYRPYYYARPAYYRPYPYYYRPYPYYAPAYPIGFGIGFGFGPRWGW